MSKSKYKDVSGRYRTESLFKETSRAGVIDRYPPAFVLNAENHTDGTPSMRQIYMDIADPTEYAFAEFTLGSWQHWTRLCACEWFKPYLAEWREELTKKLKSTGVSLLKEIAMDPANKSSAQAARWLAEGNFNEQPKKRGPGRPSKAEVDAELSSAVQEAKDLHSDALRLGVSVGSTKPN